MRNERARHPCRLHTARADHRDDQSARFWWGCGAVFSGSLLGFVDLSRRAELVDHGETALLRIARELKLALSNSVRISADRRTLEFLRTAWGGRYRAEVDFGDRTSDALDLSLTRDSFQMLDVPGTVSGIVGGGNQADCLALYNTGQPADCSTHSATDQCLFRRQSGGCRGV